MPPADHRKAANQHEAHVGLDQPLEQLAEPRPLAHLLSGGSKEPQRELAERYAFSEIHRDRALCILAEALTAHELVLAPGVVLRRELLGGALPLSPFGLRFHAPNLREDTARPHPGSIRTFGRMLDADERIDLFLKLPRQFKIETPVGTYSPDWA